MGSTPSVLQEPIRGKASSGEREGDGVEECEHPDTEPFVVPHHLDKGSEQQQLRREEGDQSEKEFDNSAKETSDHVRLHYYPSFLLPVFYGGAKDLCEPAFRTGEESSPPRFVSSSQRDTFLISQNRHLLLVFYHRLLTLLMRKHSAICSLFFFQLRSSQGAKPTSRVPFKRRSR